MPGLLDFMGLGNMPEGGVGGMLTEAGIGSDAVAGARRKPYDRFGAPPTVASTGGTTPVFRMHPVLLGCSGLAGGPAQMPSHRLRRLRLLAQCRAERCLSLLMVRRHSIQQRCRLRQRPL